MVEKSLGPSRVCYSPRLVASFAVQNSLARRTSLGVVVLIVVVVQVVVVKSVGDVLVGSSTVARVMTEAFGVAVLSVSIACNV